MSQQPNQNETIAKLGMYPLQYANTWPDLSAQLATMYANYTSKLPFLTNDWLREVMAIHGKNGYILVPAPIKVNGEVIPLARGSAAHAAMWQKFSDDARSAINKYAAGKAAEGRVELARVNSAAYWANLRYEVASVIAAPALVVADGAKTLAKRNWGKLILFGLGLVAVAYVVIRIKNPTKGNSP